MTKQNNSENYLEEDMEFLSSLMKKRFVEGSTYYFLNGILDALDNILFPILIVVASVGTIYAIYLAILLAKAENAEKREEAKKRIVNVVIAIVVLVVLILLMKLFTEYAPKILGVDDSDVTDGAIGLLRLR